MQRTRLLSAALRECAAKGAAGVTVSGVTAEAGASRRTFYEFFPDAKHCVLAAIEERLERAGGIMEEAHVHRASWSESVRLALGALLEHFEREPDAGRLLVVETLRAGPEAINLRQNVLAALAGALDEAAAPGPRSAVCPLTGEATVGAVLAILHDRLAREPRPRLTGLLNELMCVILAPYLGPTAARRQLQRTADRASSSARARQDPLLRLPMRLTYRTMRVLIALDGQPRLSNREVGTAAGIDDQGQISKMLTRLHGLELIQNVATSERRYAANAWMLTARGAEIAARVRREGL